MALYNCSFIIFYLYLQSPSMSTKLQFARQTREQIVNSVWNRSKSKQMWSFSKKKRFQPIKTQCPVAFYQALGSTISTKKVAFTTSTRKLFTDHSDAPLPGTYQHDIPMIIKSSVFGESRDKCAFRSYLSKDHAKIPAPNQYENNLVRRMSGYSLRPKTANHRNYFIDNKEKQHVPSPSEYQIDIERQGKIFNSKFKSTVLGRSGPRKTQARFYHSQEKTPGPSSYHPKTVSLRSETTGGTIGFSNKASFVDFIEKLSYQPGPGKYELPTQFGHYTKTDRQLVHTLHRKPQQKK